MDTLSIFSSFTKVKSDPTLLPQEEVLAVQTPQQSLSIGIPAEIDPNEKRICLTPEGVETLVHCGYTILIEKNAGAGAFFSDLEYSEKGAIIVDNKEEVYQTDIIAKIACPTAAEAQMIKERSLLSSILDTGQICDKGIKYLLQKKVTAIESGLISTRAGEYPVRDTILPIEGKAAILKAASLMSNVNGGKGVLLGSIIGVEPTEVVLLGAGTTALHASQTALGLGATVKVFSSSLKNLTDIQQNTTQSLFTSVLSPQALYRAFRTADIVIGTYDLWEENLPFMVTEEMVKSMKKGSIIIDLSVGKDSCFETVRFNHDKGTFKKHGVMHCCVANLSSQVAHTTSMALNNVFAPMLIDFAHAPNIGNLLKRFKGLRNSVYTYNGVLTSYRLGNKYNLPFQNIDLLAAAF